MTSNISDIKRNNALKHYIRQDGISKNLFDENVNIRRLAIELYFNDRKKEAD